MSALAKYDAACRALAEAVSAEEVMRVHVTAAGIEAVARMAGDFENELKAAMLRTRAAARLGDMIREGEETGIIAKHGGNRKGKSGTDQDSARELDPKPATLKEIGVSNRLSARARQLSGIGAQAVAAMLDRMERESRTRGVVAHNVIHQTLGKRNADTRRQVAQELSDAAALKPTGRKFAVLYADPAWKRKAGIGNRAYENHYVTMTWEDLLAMPVKDRLLPDGWGFIWIPRAHLLAAVEIEADTSLGRAKVKMPLAWAIMLAWGFNSYSTCFVWTKTDEAKPDDHGLGLIAWDQDELLLLFKRGSGLPKPDTDKKYGSNHRERAGEHSAKPAFYRQMINDMTGGVPVLELFAREDDEHPLPENFYTWGNESRNTAEADEPDIEVSPEGTPHAADTGENHDDLEPPAFLDKRAPATEGAQ
jgi:N6-adenosine-specific RNA methylase IME4